MKENPLGDLVSVIVPVYNVESYLATCVQSIIAQTYSNIEIILVDDGSKDSSGQICDDLCKTDERISVVHQKNMGLSEARNSGLEICKGTWITFVDSDDIVSPDMVERLVQTAYQTESSIVICDAYHNKEQKIPPKEESSTLVVMSSDRAIEALFYQDAFLPSAWGKCYHKDVFSGIRFPKGKLFEDIAIMGLLFEKAEVISYLKEKLYTYVHRENSITTHAFSDEDCYILDICDFYCDRYNSRPALHEAAQIYRANCSLRVWLTLPDDPKYNYLRDNCADRVLGMYHSIMKNNKVRKKLRIGAFCFVRMQPLIKTIHKRVNRWK